MLLIAIRKGGAACSCACPFYEESGIVRGLYNMPLKTHCRMVMNPWMVDCDKYDPMCIDKMEVRETGNLVDIYATIYCERESHKGIIIGKQGKMLKRIGLEARRDIESLLDCHVNLQLWVKYKEDWRNKPAVLHELGYE